MKIHFILICEGSSDEALISHLQSLLVACGVDEVTGTPLDFVRTPYKPGTIEGKIKIACELEKNFDLLFVHRDSDSIDPNPRYTEIALGVERSQYNGRWIGVVPVQELEAWLLLDELAIRRVSGRPSGREPLALPDFDQIEATANPKEILFEAIRVASKTKGRDRKKLNKQLPALRKQLINGLTIDGSLLQLPSWRRLKEDIIHNIAPDNH
jgi:hypothetical protein